MISPAPVPRVSARCLLLACACLCVSVASTTTWAAPEATRIEVSADGSQVSLELTEVPLADVLEQLAIKAGFALKVRGSLDEPVTLRPQDESITKARARLLSRRSYAMKYASTDAQGLPGLPKWLVVVDRSQDGQRAGGSSRVTTGDRVVFQPPTPEDQEQLQTIQTLRRGNPAEALRPLSALLRSAASPRVRQSALAALAEIDAATALRAIKGAIGDSDPAVRQQALRELLAIDASAAAQELTEILQSHSNPAMRVFAADALAVLAPAESTAVLHAATKDSHPPVRDAAKQALVRAGG